MKPDRWGYAEWAHASTMLWSRSGGRCEACGQPIVGDAARHHRQRRAIGGDRLANLVLLHPRCHDDVHAHPAASRERGLIVSMHVPDPAGVPLTLPTSAVVLLDDTGTYLPHAA